MRENGLVQVREQLLNSTHTDYVITGFWAQMNTFEISKLGFRVCVARYIL